MTELDFLRREFDAIPEPDAQSVARARDSLQRLEESRGRRGLRRPRVLLAAAVVVAAAALIAVGRPFSRGGVDVANADPAAAGFRALSAKTGIWHYRSRSTSSMGARISERAVTEGWSTRRDLPWFARSVTQRTPAGGATFVEESSEGRCGSVIWDGPEPGWLRFVSQRVADEPDPATAYRFAYLRGTVISQTAVHYHGIPAYRVLIHFGEWRETWTIRRSDYMPLQTTAVNTKLGPVPESSTTTYTLFELLPRSANTIALLQPRQHPGASILRYGGKPHPGCARFRR